ncbi:MAG: hypothetical protein J3K34DRAFT_420408 [Monoraphidium minutum]|nr:MAG: hypothetical protein J3K34DRAFT_420408 [Monoraphidium minutum]
MNLRRIHWRLIRDRGLTEAHWERFFQLFKETLAGRPEVPDATKDRAIASVATTRLYFRPIEPEEEASGVYLAPPPPPAPQLLQL